MIDLLRRALIGRGAHREREERISTLERELEIERSRTVERFHELYYDSSKRTWQDTYWMGTPILKCPFDMWVYQEIVYETQPDYIIETGTAFGGSALYLAHLCDNLGKGRVLTVDLRGRPNHTPPEHERIEYIKGSSTGSNTLARIREEIGGEDKPGTVLAILDSDHSYEHVIKELRIYSRLVTPDSYLIVEDSNVNGHPVHPEFGPGPMEAIERFLRETDEFTVDESREKFFVTFNPRGFLRKI